MIYTNNKLILAVLTLLALMAAFASAQTVNQGVTQNANQAVSDGSVDQSINQRANQQALALNNTTINQSISQRAGQIAAGAGNVSQNIGQGANQVAAGAGNVSQNIGQSGNQLATGSNVSQNLRQSANQTVTQTIQNYFSVQQTTQLTSDQRTIINNRAGNFLVLYPEKREFIMPVADFDMIISQGTQEVAVLDVSPLGNALIPAGYGRVIRIPLANLVNNIASIPFGAAVAVISDNDIDSAVAMTLLRMYGYNAWILPVGVCGLQGTSVAGMAVSSGLTAQSQTVGGVTTGQTTGTVSSTNY